MCGRAGMSSSEGSPRARLAGCLATESILFSLPLRLVTSHSPVSLPSFSSSSSSSDSSLFFVRHGRFLHPPVGIRSDPRLPQPWRVRLSTLGCNICRTRLRRLIACCSWRVSAEQWWPQQSVERQLGLNPSLGVEYRQRLRWRRISGSPVRVSSLGLGAFVGRRSGNSIDGRSGCVGETDPKSQAGGRGKIRTEPASRGSDLDEKRCHRHHLTQNFDFVASHAVGGNDVRPNPSLDRSMQAKLGASPKPDIGPTFCTHPS